MVWNFNMIRIICHNYALVVKDSNRFLKYVWPYILHERVKTMEKLTATELVFL